jgi:hypothetical protein
VRLLVKKVRRLLSLPAARFVKLRFEERGRGTEIQADIERLRAGDPQLSLQIAKVFERCPPVPDSQGYPQLPACGSQKEAKRRIKQPDRRNTRCRAGSDLREDLPDFDMHVPFAIGV